MPKNHKRTPTPATGDGARASEAERIAADRQQAEEWARKHGVTQCKPDIAAGSIEIFIKPRKPGRPRSAQP